MAVVLVDGVADVVDPTGEREVLVVVALTVVLSIAVVVLSAAVVVVTSAGVDEHVGV